MVWLTDFHKVSTNTLDEIAVFELLIYLNTWMLNINGLPSRTEQVEILRFYNHWFPTVTRRRK